MCIHYIVISYSYSTKPTPKCKKTPLPQFYSQTYAWKLGRNVIMQIERGAMGTKCQMSGMHFQTLVGWR